MNFGNTIAIFLYFTKMQPNWTILPEYEGSWGLYFLELKPGWEKHSPQCPGSSLTCTPGRVTGTHERIWIIFADTLLPTMHCVLAMISGSLLGVWKQSVFWVLCVSVGFSWIMHSWCIDCCLQCDVFESPFTSRKVLFHTRDLRKTTALLSRPCRGHFMVTHLTSSPQA